MNPMTTARWQPVHSWQWGALIVCPALLGYFLNYFHPAPFQASVDLAWVVTVVCWIAAFWQPDTPSQPHLRHPYWFYALYVAALLPFATNWRWAMAGDSLGWSFGGLALRLNGPDRSFLSTIGVHQFGYLQMQLHNLFMLGISPTLFWHRVGQIAVGTLMMAAVYTVYTRLVSPTFGMLVAGCTMTVSVMIVHTYCSYPLLDGIACGHAILAVGLWIRRDPTSRRAWLMLGFLSGFMLFLTPTAWFMALCVWVWLVPQALVRRWPLAHVVIAAGTAVIAGLPLLWQWSQGTGGQLFSFVTSPAWTLQKVQHLAWQTVTIPFASLVDIAGAFGPQLPPGFRWLFVPGILLTPLFGKRFPGARLMFCIYLVHVVILTFSQGPYDDLSVKRALVLIPMATYFTCLLFWRYIRSVPVVLAIIAVWASFAVYNMVVVIQPGRTGYNFIDGIVEASQRFGDAPVCIVMPRNDWAEGFAPGAPLDRLYHISTHLQRVLEPNDPACREVLCYSPLVAELDLPALGYTPVPMRNTVELRCGQKLAAAGTVPITPAPPAG